MPNTMVFMKGATKLKVNRQKQKANIEVNQPIKHQPRGVNYET